MWKKYVKQLGMPESYISITLGLLVVIVAGLLAYNYLSKTKVTQEAAKEAPNTEKQKEEVALLPTTHTVNTGETLWTIAEKYYNSGYNWVTIANENKLADANFIEEGEKLTIPKAETIRPESEKVSSAAVETSYTVAKGDNLWNIAVREYGDGYAWPKIAQANNLAQPNLIHPGNVLKIPR